MGHLTAYNLKAESHSRHIAGALVAACARVNEEEAVPRVTEDLRNMSVSANEYVGVPVVDDQQAFAYFYGGTSLLIMVGVVLDTLKQIESYLLMRHYDGLMKTGRIQGRH